MLNDSNCQYSQYSLTLEVVFLHLIDLYVGAYLTSAAKHYRQNYVLAMNFRTLFNDNNSKLICRLCLYITPTDFFFCYYYSRKKNNEIEKMQNFQYRRKHCGEIMNQQNVKCT